MIMLNGKDSFWLQLEVCREFQRSRCTRSDGECKFAHPPNNVEIQSNGRVTACYDSIKVSCSRILFVGRLSANCHLSPLLQLTTVSLNSFKTLQPEH